jgi:hypothetical protein
VGNFRPGPEPKLHQAKPETAQSSAASWKEAIAPILAQASLFALAAGLLDVFPSLLFDPEPIRIGTTTPYWPHIKIVLCLGAVIGGLMRLLVMSKPDSKMLQQNQYYMRRFVMAAAGIGTAALVICCVGMVGYSEPGPDRWSHAFNFAIYLAGFLSWPAALVIGFNVKH